MLAMLQDDADNLYLHSFFKEFTPNTLPSRAVRSLSRATSLYIYYFVCFLLKHITLFTFSLSVIFTNSFLFHYHRFFNTIPIDYFFCQARISGFEVALIALENYIFRTIPDLDKERSACLESTHNRFRVKCHRVKNDLHLCFFRKLRKLSVDVLNVSSLALD